MAIAVIKHDENGNPIRAKYRIVALGNLDSHTWTKHDCYAPVLHQMELRLIIAMAVREGVIPKTGDITQAFCQSYLPKGEDYICRPPPGCPLTQKGTYLRLKKTLYGLKRSPKHFYDLARKLLLSIGLQPHPYSPCLFHGVLIEGQPPLYLGLYVDDFIYFSANRTVETKFETLFSSKINMELNGPITHFLGIKFSHTKHDDGSISIKMSQEAFVETLVETAGLSGEAVGTPRTPYRSGLAIDTIPPDTNVTPDKQHNMNHRLQTLVGSLNWLAISTRPDIAPVTNFLAKYSNKASSGHIQAAKHVIRYIKGTKSKGITFSNKERTNINSFVKFPVNPTSVVSLADANWGPQDQSHPHPDKPQEVELFKSRSMSGFMVWLGGPIHWVAKRQSITARSSAEAEIYATDECVKHLIQLSYILEGFDILNAIMPKPTPIYNDNTACVAWSKTTTTKGLRHIQMRENAIREAITSDFCSIMHIAGNINLADIFTKEDRDVKHFLTARDIIMGDADTFHITFNPTLNHVDKIPAIDSTPIARTMCLDQPLSGGCQLGSWGKWLVTPQYT